MSILDSIRDAERKAELMRTEANERVRVLLDDTRIKSEEKAMLLYEETKKQEKRIDQDTIKNLEMKENEIFLAYEKLDQKTEAFARSRINEAIDYIIKKVFDL